MHFHSVHTNPFSAFLVYAMLIYRQKCQKRKTGNDVIVSPLAYVFIAYPDRALQELSNNASPISIALLEAELEFVKVLSFFLSWSFFLGS